MKKLLILAYDFPPYVSVGGLRPHSWYKYLKEFDIYPVVITRQWENKYGNYLDYISPSKSQNTEIEETDYGTIIRTPYKPNLANKIMLKYGDNKFKIIRKIISAYYEILQWVLPIGAKYNLYKEGHEYLKNNKVDAIIATGEPFILFKYASILSEKNNIPWIADYRDPWTTNKLRSTNIVLKKFNKFNEKRYTKNVNKIITVSLFFKRQILKVVSNKNISTEIIINGFDESLFANEDIFKQKKDLLNIAFIGTIYKWHPIESFIEVCNNFSQERNFKINFYGINDEVRIKKMIKEKYGNLKTMVTFYPKLENKKLINELEKNNVLLLFNYYSFVGTKIYDYLAVKRKILFCYTDDADAIELKLKHYNLDESNSTFNNMQEDIIKETNSGILVKDKNHLKQVLQDLYNEHKEKGFIECKTTNIEKYSRKLQAQKLADILKDTIFTK